jgi:hypothetical protein
MNKKTLVIAFLLLLHLTVRAQDFTEVTDYFKTLEKEVTDKKGLMTFPALNVLMAKKVNTYLSGSGDLALNKSYFIIDPTDGRLFLGFNTAKDPSKNDTRTKWILTTGIKADAADAFSTIYKGGEKNLQPNIGASVKITLLGRGSIKFNNDKGLQMQQLEKITFIVPEGLENYTEQELAAYYRGEIQNELTEAMTKDIADFESKIKGVGDVNYRKWKREKFYKAGTAKYKSLYITKEAERIDEDFLYTSFRNQWLSLDLYVPFTNQSYDVGKDFASPVTTQQVYNLEASLLWNTIYENNKTRLLTSLSTGLKIQNNINTESLKKYNVSDYKKLGGTDTLNLAQIKSEDVYVGDYKSFASPFFRGQLVYFFMAQKAIGLSVLAEKYFQTYNPLNIKLGVPFTLAGKDDDTKVNFEIQFKWNDFNNDIFPDKSRTEKFLIGLSVGVPLTSKIY